MGLRPCGCCLFEISDLGHLLHRFGGSISHRLGDGSRLWLLPSLLAEATEAVDGHLSGSSSAGGGAYLTSFEQSHPG